LGQEGSTNKRIKEREKGPKVSRLLDTGYRSWAIKKKRRSVLITKLMHLAGLGGIVRRRGHLRMYLAHSFGGKTEKTEVLSGPHSNCFMRGRKVWMRGRWCQLTS